MENALWTTKIQAGLAAFLEWQHLIGPDPPSTKLNLSTIF